MQEPLAPVESSPVRSKSPTPLSSLTSPQSSHRSYGPPLVQQTTATSIDDEVYIMAEETVRQLADKPLRSEHEERRYRACLRMLESRRALQQSMEHRATTSNQPSGLAHAQQSPTAAMRRTTPPPIASIHDPASMMPADYHMQQQASTALRCLSHCPHGRCAAVAERDHQ